MSNKILQFRQIDRLNRQAFLKKNEKINLIKSVGILIGFSGIIFLFSDNILINENNLFSAFLILFGSCFYVIGGLLTLKISNKENENVTSFFVKMFPVKHWEVPVAGPREPQDSCLERAASTRSMQ